MFKEEAAIEYEIINGKKVPKVKCETEVVVRNKETGIEYDSDEAAENDINDPNTDTTREQVVRSVKIKVAKMPSLKADSKL